MTIEENKDLRPLHTFHLDVKARYFVSVRSEKDLIEVFCSNLYKNTQRLILGGGSNVLFTSDFGGLVIQIALQGIEVVSEDAQSVRVRAGAGVVWHDFVLFCIENGFGGVENLSLIPGTVGAAPMQNIGAYGVEIKDVFSELNAFEIATQQVKTFSKADCHFGYRESVFKNQLKGKYVITSVTFELSKAGKVNTSYGAITTVLQEWGIQQPGIADVSRAVIHIRQSKLPNPNEIGNAGSFFKNPSISPTLFDSLKNEYPEIPGYVQDDGTVKVPAGWLIERDGWKGRRIGDIGVHKNQALVLVNYGQGRGSEIWQLAMDIRQSVLNRFGIELSPEVNVI